MGIDSVASQLYSIQSRKKVPLKTAIGIMAREELAARFSVYNLVRTITRSRLLAMAAETAFGKGTPEQRKQEEELNKKEANEKRFKQFTVNSLVNLNNRINVLASITERNTNLISQLYGELGNYKNARKFDPMRNNVPSNVKIPARAKSIKGKLDEITKELEQLKKSKKALGAPKKKKKDAPAAPAEPKKDGFFDKLLGLLGEDSALGSALGGGGLLRMALALAGGGATALSLAELPKAFENIKQRMEGDVVYDDRAVEGVSVAKDTTVATVAAGGLAAFVPMAYRMAAKNLRGEGVLSNTAFGKKASASFSTKMTDKQLKIIDQLEKRYLKQGMLPNDARNKAFEVADKYMSGKYGSTASRFLTGKPDPKWLLANKVLTKFSRLFPVVTAGLMAYEISRMAGYHADYENKIIGFREYKEKMAGGYSTITQIVGVPGISTLLGSLAGTAIGGPLGTLAGATAGILGGIGLSFFAEKPSDYIGEKLFEILHQGDVPPDVIEEAEKEQQKARSAAPAGGTAAAAGSAQTPMAAASSSAGGAPAVSSQISSLETSTAATTSELQGVRDFGTAKEAVDFFVRKGWTKEQAAGIVGNLLVEAPGLRTNSFNPAENAYGLAQWHPDRQARYERTYRKPIQQANFEEQLEFIHWELNNDEKKAGAALASASTATDAATVVDAMYERSSGKARQKRIDFANQLVDDKYVVENATEIQRRAKAKRESAAGVPGGGGTRTTGVQAAQAARGGGATGGAATPNMLPSQLKEDQKVTREYAEEANKKIKAKYLFAPNETEDQYLIRVNPNPEEGRVYFVNGKKYIFKYKAWRTVSPRLYNDRDKLALSKKWTGPDVSMGRIEQAKPGEIGVRERLFGEAEIVDDESVPDEKAIYNVDDLNDLGIDPDDPQAVAEAGYIKIPGSRGRRTYKFVGPNEAVKVFTQTNLQQSPSISLEQTGFKTKEEAAAGGYVQQADKTFKYSGMKDRRIQELDREISAPRKPNEQTDAQIRNRINIAKAKRQAILTGRPLEVSWKPAAFLENENITNYINRVYPNSKDGSQYWVSGKLYVKKSTEISTDSVPIYDERGKLKNAKVVKYWEDETPSGMTFLRLRNIQYTGLPVSEEAAKEILPQFTKQQQEEFKKEYGKKTEEKNVDGITLEQLKKKKALGKPLTKKEQSAWETLTGVVGAQAPTATPTAAGSGTGVTPASSGQAAGAGMTGASQGFNVFVSPEQTPKVDENDGFSVNVDAEKTPKVDDGGYTPATPAASETPAAPAASETPTATPTEEKPTSVSPLPTDATVPPAIPLAVDGKTSSEEEEIPEVMVTAKPRKMPTKPEQVQETATPVETDSLMGAGINYGETARPTTMTIEGFNPKDYPDEYFPALRRYLAGTNIGSKSAREKAQQLAAEDIKQAILAGSIRPRGRTKLISLETTYEALTPQTRFQTEPSAQVVSPMVPEIGAPSTQTVLPPPDTETAETVDESSDMLESRLSSIEQQISMTMQSTKSLGASAAELGKRVAKTTMAVDNMGEFRTARNLDGGIGSYRNI